MAAEARDAPSVTLNQQMLSAPTFHALEAKCYFLTSLFPCLPLRSHSSKVGVDSALPSAVSTGPWGLESVTWE